MPAEMTDEALMLAYQAGDAAAFELLYRRYRSRLYRYLARQCAAGVAEELSQDCWMRVIRSRTAYEVSAKFTTWLFRIAHNRLIDHYRAHERDAVAAYDDAEILASVIESAPDAASLRPDSLLERGQLAQRLIAAIEDLPPPQREAFLLQQEGELTVSEIAAATGVGAETAKSRLRYALARLRSSLNEVNV